MCNHHRDLSIPWIIGDVKSDGCLMITCVMVQVILGWELTLGWFRHWDSEGLLTLTAVPLLADPVTSSWSFK